MNVGNWQIERGRWVFAFFWLDWTIAHLPLIRRGRAEGNIWCIGPFRIGVFPLER